MKLLPTKNHALLAIPAAAFCVSAQAIDLLPRDLTAPMPGFQVVRVAHQVSEREDFYENGSNIGPGAGITISQTQLRIGRSFTLAGMPALTYIQGGYGSTKPTGALTTPPFSTTLDIRGDQGTTDIGALLAVWPYTDREKNQHMGLGLYFFAPTGGFDNNRLRPLNMSDNRYKAALQAGYQTPVFNKKVVWLVAGDVMWFEKDDDYRNVLSTDRETIYTQRQKPMIALQTALSYSVSDTAWIGVSYLYDHGAQTRHTPDKNPDTPTIKTHRFMLSASAGTPIGRFALQYGRDIKREYGFKEKNRFTASFVKFF
jgi:hypothetical protein